MRATKEIIVEVCYTQEFNPFIRETILTIIMPPFDSWEAYSIIESPDIPYTEWTKLLKEKARQKLSKYIEDPTEWKLEYIEFIGEVD